MNNNSSLARWCGMAGLGAIVLGVVTGVIGLVNPADVYAPPPTIWNYTATLGKIVIIIEGIGIFGITASFIGYHLIGAVGNGALGKTATVLSAIGNLASAFGFIHSAFIGELSPIINLSYLSLPGYILLTLAALRVKRVSTVQALLPVGIAIGLMAIEFALPSNGIVDMVHQLVWAALTFVVLSETGKAQSLAEAGAA